MSGIPRSKEGMHKMKAGLRACAFIQSLPTDFLTACQAPHYMLEDEYNEIHFLGTKNSELNKHSFDELSSWLLSPAKGFLYGYKIASQRNIFVDIPQHLSSFFSM